MSHAQTWLPYREPGRQPKGRPRFDRNNFLGRRCVFAWYGGLAGGQFAAECPGDVIRARIHSLGPREMEFTLKQWGSRTISAENGLHWGRTPLSSGVVWRQLTPRDEHMVWTTDANHNIPWKDAQAITLVAIFKTNGQGSDNAVYDPRIVTKDSGVFESDHHYMLGGVKTGAVDAGGPTEARTRMKIGGTTTTLVLNTPTWQADAMNLSAVTYDGSTLALHLLREDGQRGRTSQAQSGDLSINDVTAILGIGGTADGDDNFFDGDIHAILAFDGAFDDVQILQQLFHDWTQIFEPFWVPNKADETTAIIKTINETVNSSESVSSLKDLVRRIDEGVTLTENLSRALGLSRVYDETVALSENLSTARNLFQVRDELVTWNEQILPLKEMLRSINESVQLNEQNLHLLTQELNKVISENRSISEATQKELALLLVRIANETVSVGEALLRVRGRARNIDESMQVMESRDRLLDLRKTVGEVQQISENVQPARGWARVVSEVEQRIESLEKARSIVVVTNEAVAFLESVGRGAVVLGSLAVKAIRTFARLSASASSKARMDGSTSSKARLDGDIKTNGEEDE